MVAQNVQNKNEEEKAVAQNDKNEEKNDGR